MLFIVARRSLSQEAPSSAPRPAEAQRSLWLGLPVLSGASCVGGKQGSWLQAGGTTQFQVWSSSSFLMLSLPWPLSAVVSISWATPTLFPSPEK